MLRVGLTGGIASGKSRVLEHFAEAGFVTLDLDRVAHDVMAPGGSAHAAVLEAFGPEVRAQDGSIDRKKLGPIVFADVDARERLNAVVHPRVREEEMLRLAAVAGRAGAVSVSDAALLVESGGHLRYDRLVVAWCSPEEQLRRLRGRDALSEAAARLRVAAQMSNDEKRRFAHFAIDTGGTLEQTASQARALTQQLRELALARAPRGPLARQRSEALVANSPARGPRGLDPLRLLERLAGEEHVEMRALAALLDPPPDGPWYRPARSSAQAPGPEALAAVLALFCAARRGFDRDFLAAVAASLARLTHEAASAIATAVLAALVASDLLQGASAVDAAIEQGRLAAQRWGGAPPELSRIRALADQLTRAPAAITPQLRRVVGRFV